MGRRIVERLAEEGWAVAVHYHSSATEADAVVARITASGGQAVALGADLGDPRQAEGLAHAAADRLGPLDLLVNNASQFEFDSLETLEPGLWSRLMAANLQGPVFLAKGFAARCGAGADPVIVNILDQKIVNLNPDFFSYTATKMALHGATQLLASALAGRVRVHGLAPGLSLPSADQTPEEFEKAHRMAPLGRGSTPDDIANAVLFIAAVPGYASDLLVVDGGQHLQPLSRDVMYVVREES